MLVVCGIDAVTCATVGMSVKRDAVVRGFRSGSVWVLICTDVMCRGMDFKGVNLVVNYDFPNSDYVYIHRIGEQPAWCHLVLLWICSVAGSIIVVSCSSVRPESLLTQYLAEYLIHFHRTYVNDALWDRDERFTIWVQTVKGQGHGGIKYAGNSTFWAC